MIHDKTAEANQLPRFINFLYVYVAETFALINLVIPEAVGKGLERIKAMMDRLNS